MRRPSGSSIAFQAQAGSHHASTAGDSRKLDYRISLVNADNTPCARDEPALMDMVLPGGMSMRFSTATGKAVSMTTAAGNTITAESRQARVQVKRSRSGRIRSIFSRAQGLMLCSYGINWLRVEWFAPQDVEEGDGGYSTTAEPYKTILYETWKELDPAVAGDEAGAFAVTVTRTTTARPGQAPQVTMRREQPGRVTITRGEGDEAVVRTVTGGYIPNFNETPSTTGNRWERIETLGRANGSGPVSSVRTMKKLTAGGWLDVSRTEGYGTPLARTTLYVYNAAFRLSLVIRPDGGYTRYEYDAEHRAVLTASPWAGGGERATRTAYMNLLFNDHRPAVEEEVILAEDGAQTVLNRKQYAYEKTPQSCRTTVTETALGSDQVHTSFEETYGPMDECAYARGRSRYNRSVDGMRNLYSYEETTDHGASWKVTTTIMGDRNGAPVDHAMNVDYLSAGGLTLRSERHVRTDQGWSILSFEEYLYDAEKRRVKTTRGNGRTGTTEWMCCGPLKETDEEGIVTSYGYNSALQLVETIRSATETTPETIISYTRDAAGRAVSTRTDAGPMTTITQTRYDILGRTVSTTDALGRITAHAYSDDGLHTTVTAPSGATLEERHHFDGSTINMGGSGQRAVETQMALTPEGILTTTLSQGVTLLRTLVDGFGQTIRQDRPNTLGGLIATETRYNKKGQIVRTQTAGMAPTLMEYDEMGHQSRQTILLDAARPNDPRVNRITELEERYQIMADGVYRVQTQTTCNAQGQKLTQTVATRASQLDPDWESRTVTTDVYSNSREQRTIYAGPARRIRYATSDGSETEDQTLLADGFVISHTNYANLTTLQERTYTTRGIIIRRTDPRGNTTITQTDIVGRTVKTTDAEGNTTTIAYIPCCDNPALITDALGGTTYYVYDQRGRKTAEYGAAVQPVCFAYDEADRLVQLTTFRAREEGDITTDPTERTDGDLTRWTYDDATGLELVKTYADGSQVIKTCDELNRPATLTKARGVVTGYAYAPLTGELIAVTHSDGTQGWGFTHNHLGQITALTDASGAHEIAYDPYGRAHQETLLAGKVTAAIEEHFDPASRSEGYTLTLGGAIVQTNFLQYDCKGRLSSMSVDGNERAFTWEYDPASGFPSQLSYPNGMARNDSYMPKRDLIASIQYRSKESNTLLAGHTYGYDALGRPVSRQDNTGEIEMPQIHHFTYNAKSELINDVLGSDQINGAYDYDNIGNRKTTQEDEKHLSCHANSLNQYTVINTAGTGAGDGTFIPAFDADGNQTLIKTITGIWQVAYDANDRPVTFTSQDNATVIHCGYDFMGRRFEKKTTINGTLTSHQRYLYRGYLQIAKLDIRADQPVLTHTYIWDPTQPTATRLLGMTRRPHDNGNALEYLYYVHNALKNVTALIDHQGIARAAYSYRPFGGIKTMQGDLAGENKFRFSCEYSDDDLGLIYYNYRHLNPADGRWINRDPILENGGWNLFGFVANRYGIDVLGLEKNCKFNGQNVVLTFDGMYLKGPDINVMAVSGYPSESKIIETLPGAGWFTGDTYITHRLSFDYSKNSQKTKNVGPIPEGKWKLCVDKTNDETNALRHKSFNIISQQAWGKNSWHLIPEKDTDISTNILGETRNNIFLHGGCIPGSKGCIDAFDGGELIIRKLVDKIKKTQNCCIITIDVKYKYEKIILEKKSVMQPWGPFANGPVYASPWMIPNQI